MVFVKFSFSYHIFCAGIVAFADCHNCTELVTESESFARQHFIDVVQNEEFMDISAKQLSRLLANDDLNILSEERVFEAALAWIKYDPDVRKVHSHNDQHAISPYVCHTSSEIKAMRIQEMITKSERGFRAKTVLDSLYKIRLFVVLLIIII